MKCYIHVFMMTICLVGIANAEDVFVIYRKAQEAFRARDYRTFLQLAQDMLVRAENHSGVQYQYARALAVNDRQEDAIKVLERVSRMGASPPAKNDEAFVSIKNKKSFQEVVDIFERNRRADGLSHVAHQIPGKDLIPEGIACDSVEKKCYIGSTYRRKIVVVDSSGAVMDFVSEKQDGVWGLVGMEVDPIRRHLWAVTSNLGANMPMMHPEPESEGKTAVLRYDLRNGKLLKKYEIGDKQNPRFFNDVAIAPNGDVYVTESSATEIYRITAASDTLDRILPGGSMTFPNGIAVSPDGKLVFLSHFEGITIFKPASGEVTRMQGPPEIQLGGFDGMVFYRNSLVGVQALSGGVDRIVRLHLDKDMLRVDRAEALQVNHPLMVQPTTGDMVGDEFYYIANSQLRSFDDKHSIFSMEKLQDTVILKTDLLDSEREELLKLHETDRLAHWNTDVDLLLSTSPDVFVSVSSGKIEQITRDQEREMFETYFQGAKYAKYDDLARPIVFVSADGQSGWVITQTEVRRTQAEKVQEFVYAGIMAYQKQGGKWIRVSNVSTFQ